MENRIYNFAAGPAVLNEEVLKRAQKELLNFNGVGMSVMEMSHRSNEFLKIFNETKEKLRFLMNIPDNYEILFLQGGASSVFSMVPLNLMDFKRKADYILTGNFSNIAYKEARKYGETNIVYDGSKNGYKRIPEQEELILDKDASYLHYCANNTIYGTEWHYIPKANVPLIVDMSSNICSKELDVSKFDLIYAGAQKNLAPAGLTIVIINKDLKLYPKENIPLMYDLKMLIEKDSMYNTPPCFQIYMLGLTLDWLISIGGLKEIERINKLKADLLYKTLENTKIFKLHADIDSRSNMNVTFRTTSQELDDKFIFEAKQIGLVNLKGHRITKGMRASIYNAMPIEGVKKLAGFIEEFDKENRNYV